MTEAARPRLAAGRDADVFDLGDGTVLRRYRRRPVPAFEVEVMLYARACGFPAPEVISHEGPDLVLERVDGPTMQRTLEADPSTLDTHAAALADLHHRLHGLVAPDWLPQRADGDRVLHLDLHPANVILSPKGPVVIDWANAGRGPAGLDPALAIAIFASARANADDTERRYIDEFIRAFASRFDRGELEAWLPHALEVRAADRNVTDPERRALEGFRLSIE